MTNQKATSFLGSLSLITEDFSNNRTLGRFPFVRTDRTDQSSHEENFTFNLNYPARSVKS